MKLLLITLALFGAAQARSLLADKCAGEGLYPVPGKVCYDKYWSCSAKGAAPTEMPCAPGTVFNPASSSCDFKSNVSECPYVPDKCPGAGTFATGAVCSNKFWACDGAGANPTIMVCANGTWFNAYDGTCDYKENVPDCNGECASPYYIVKATPELSILEAALVATGLDAALDNTTLVATVFTPTNNAFVSLLKALNLTTETVFSEDNLPLVTEVLLTHVVPGVAAKAADLENGQELPTLNGNQTLTVDLNTTGLVKIKPEGGDAATVVFADVISCDTVVHVVDRVLLPSNI